MPLGSRLRRRRFSGNKTLWLFGGGTPNRGEEVNFPLDYVAPTVVLMISKS